MRDVLDLHPQGSSFPRLNEEMDFSPFLELTFTAHKIMFQGIFSVFFMMCNIAPHSEF